MSLYTGDYGDYNSSGNVLYGGYNAEKVATSSDFQLALDSYAAAKMWSDDDKKAAIAAAKKLVTLPGLRRRRYASTSKDERKLLTAQIRGLTADMSPITRKHGMQLLREATGARLRPRVSSAAKQRYSQEFYDYPMVDYRNWMSPTQFAQGIDGLYTPNPRRPVAPSAAKIARRNRLIAMWAAANSYAREHDWAQKHRMFLVTEAMKANDAKNTSARDKVYADLEALGTTLGGNAKAAVTQIVFNANQAIKNKAPLKREAPEDVKDVVMAQA